MAQLRRKELVRKIMLLADSTKASQREAKKTRRVIVAREQAWNGEPRIERRERMRNRLYTRAERKASP